MTTDHTPAHIARAHTLRVGWLVSYAAIRQNAKLWTQARAAVTDGVPLVFDSGAFSVATTGQPVSLLAYTSFLRAGEKWRLADWCASLDVVGNPAITYANHRSMVEAGVENAMPTIHLGTDPAWVGRYAAIGAQRIAIGGITSQLRKLHGYTDADADRWLAAVMPACARLGLRTHGFGINAEKLVRGYAWDSVDATSFASGTRFRTLPIYRDGKLRNIPLSELTGEQAEHLQRLGVDVGVLANAFVVGRNGHPQWGQLLQAGLMAVATALSEWNHTLRTLYVSDWGMGHHVLPMMARWHADPAILQRIVQAHRT